jgi:hypothetical protein
MGKNKGRNYRLRKDIEQILGVNPSVEQKKLIGCAITRHARRIRIYNSCLEKFKRFIGW